MLAENGIRLLWCRAGTDDQRRRIEALVELNAARRFQEAIDHAAHLIAEEPSLAEAWNQRAVALFGTGRFEESIRDCSQALELNPYHFGAASGMGQCYLQSSNRTKALECFRRALKLNPNLEGIRAHVLYLQRTLKSQE
jgi:tetratricopeptide (TPR) repeat protein